VVLRRQNGGQQVSVDGAASDVSFHHAKEKPALEYVVFLLVVACVVGTLYLLAMRGARRTERRRAPAGRPRVMGANDLQALRGRVGRHSRRVSPPGDPISSVARRGVPAQPVNGAVARWADTLLARKRTVDEDPEHRRRAQASVRAMVEDRFGGQGRRPDEATADARPGAGLRTPWGW